MLYYKKYNIKAKKNTYFNKNENKVLLYFSSLLSQIIFTFNLNNSRFV